MFQKQLPRLFFGGRYFEDVKLGMGGGDLSRMRSTVHMYELTFRHCMYEYVYPNLFIKEVTKIGA